MPQTVDDLYRVLEAFRTVARGINGGPTYHTNFEGRVYDVFQAPEEADSPLKRGSYCCIPLIGGETFPQGSEQGALLSSATLNIFAFTPEVKAQTLVTGTPKPIANMRDDFLKAYRLNWTLGGIAKCFPVSSTWHAGGRTGDPEFGQLVMAFRVENWFDPALLGPA